LNSSDDAIRCRCGGEVVIRYDVGQWGKGTGIFAVATCRRCHSSVTTDMSETKAGAMEKYREITRADADALLRRARWLIDHSPVRDADRKLMKEITAYLEGNQHEH
jgi:hypothetical protein